MPSHCLPDGKCQPQWHLQPPVTALATSSNRLSNRLWGRLGGPFPSNASRGKPPHCFLPSNSGGSTAVYPPPPASNRFDNRGPRISQAFVTPPPLPAQVHAKVPMQTNIDCSLADQSTSRRRGISEGGGGGATRKQRPDAVREGKNG